MNGPSPTELPVAELPGAVLFAGGVAMTTVGATRLRELKVSAAVTPESAGVMIIGRF